MAAANRSGGPRGTQALVARSQRKVQQSNEALETPRAILAYRQTWPARAVSDALTARGGAVVALLSDGAELVGATIAEQPEVVVTEELLPTLTGIEAVTQICEFAPTAFVAVQVDVATHAPAFLKAGARAVFSRRIPGPRLADLVWSALQTQDDEPFACL